MPQAADSAKAFNRQLRTTLRALGVGDDDDFLQAFVCECGCEQVAKMGLVDYDRDGGAWLEGHRPAGRRDGDY
jgi:hypothetical protein